MADGKPKKQNKPNNSPIIEQYMNKVRMAESGGDDTAKAGTSSATGRYQFTDATWKAMEKRLGRKLNIENGKDQDAAMRELTSINAETLQKNGLPVNDSNLYMMHFLGVDGGPKFLKQMQRNPNELAAKYMSAGARDANKNLLFNERGGQLTAAELFNRMAKKVSGPTVAPTQQRQSIDFTNPQDIPDVEVDNTGVRRQRPPVGADPNKVIDYSKFNFSNKQDQNRQALGLIGDEMSYLPADSNLAFSEEEQEEQMLEDEDEIQSIAKYGGTQYAYGGLLGGGPGDKDKKKKLSTEKGSHAVPKEMEEVARKFYKDKGFDEYVDPVTGKVTFNKEPKSRFGKITRVQTGVQTDKGSGTYFYGPDFPGGRDFVLTDSPSHDQIFNSPQYKEYQAALKEQNQPFIDNNMTPLSYSELNSTNRITPEMIEANRMRILNEQLSDIANVQGVRRNGGGLTGADRGSGKKQYPMVDSGDFAGGDRSYPIPTEADAIDALRLAGLHGRDDVRAKVFARYPNLKHKYGGQLDSQYNEGGLLTEFNEGGRHEDNPLGGVPQGRNEQGGMNTVEEGESKFNSYVLSDTLKLNSDDIENGFLPNDVKQGMTFSEAAKAINEHLKRNPNDKILKKTVEKHLDSLTLLNEKARLAKEELDSNLVYDAELSGVPDGQEELAIRTNEMTLGGDTEETLGGMGSLFGQYTSGSAAGAGITSSGTAGGVIGALPGAISISQDFLSTPQMDRSNLDVNTGANMGSGALKGAAMGASLGSVIPGVGTAIGAAGGAVIGATAGLVKSNKQKKAARGLRTLNATEANDVFQDKEGTIFRRDGGDMNMNYRYGGKKNNYEYQYGEDLTPGTDITPKMGLGLFEGVDFSRIGQPYQEAPTDYMSNKGGTDRPLLESVSAPMIDIGGGLIPERKSTAKPITEADKEDFKTKGKNPLQYAGVLGSALNFLEDTKAKPEVERLNRLSNRYTPNRLDKEYLMNVQAQGYENTLRGLQEASEGSGSRMAANILGANVNQIRGLSDAAFKMDEYAGTEAEKAYQYNLAVDQANNQYDMTERDINARRRAAVDDRKRASRDALLRDIGAIGKEGTQSNRLYNITGGYDAQGRYNPELAKMEANMLSLYNKETPTEATSNRYGGLLSEFIEKSSKSPRAKQKQKEEEFNNYYR